MNLEQYTRFDCPLDESILVLVLDKYNDKFELPEDSKWHFEMSMFKDSHAFAVWEDVPQPLILLDKEILHADWFSADHLFVILAHEMAHIYLKTLDESHCDKVALSILKEKGLVDAHELLTSVLNRH